MATTVRTGMTKMAPIIFRQCTLKNNYFKALFIVFLEKIGLFFRLIRASFKAKIYCLVSGDYEQSSCLSNYPKTAYLQD